MSKKLPFLYLSLSLLILFIIFSVIVAFNIFNSLDLTTTIKLQNKIPRNFDFVLSVFSLIGSVEFAGLFILFVMAIYNRSKIFITLLLLAILHIPELVFKSIVAHPGPPFSFFRYIFDFSFPSSGVKPGYSYPSGHAARTIFISIIFAFVVSKLKISKESKNSIYLGILFFDLIMLVSRVYLGEHWTSDVIGGSLLGSVFGFLLLPFLL